MLLSLNSFGVKTSVYDPWAKRDEVKREYGFELLNEVYKTKYDAIVLAVSNNEFKTIDIPKLKKKNSVVYDIKNFLDVKDKSL